MFPTQTYSGCTKIMSGGAFITGTNLEEEEVRAAIEVYHVQDAELPLDEACLDSESVLDRLEDFTNSSLSRRRI